MYGEVGEDFVYCVIIVGDVDVNIKAAFVSGAGRVNARDAVVCNEDVGGRGGLEVM